MHKIMIVTLLLLVFSSSGVAEDEQQWRTPSLSDLVYMQTEHGLVIIELAPFMAPQHVSQFKALVTEGFYDGLDFYRVIDGFVAQAGDMSGNKPSKHKTPLEAEFSRPSSGDSEFQLEQKNDFMAPETGYLHGFPAGRDPATNEEWLLHCPGTLAMARGNDKDSASTDFYVVIGQATRHLDRNMSSFGKIIYGMPALQAVTRASVNIASGVLDDPKQRSKIAWVKLAKDVKEKDRVKVQLQRSDASQVKQRLDSARKLDNAFFHYKGNGNLDLCYYQLKSRIID